MLVVGLQCHQLVSSGDCSQTCCVLWVVPENIETVVTLFRDPRRCEFEDKDWSFSIEVMVNSVVFQYICTVYAIHLIHFIVIALVVRADFTIANQFSFDRRFTGEFDCLLTAKHFSIAG